MGTNKHSRFPRNLFVNFNRLGAFLIIIFITFLVVREIYTEDQFETIVTYTILFVLPTTAFIAFQLSKGYYHVKKCYSLAYLLLGIGMTFWLIAETLWTYVGSIDEAPYPSIADIFFMGTLVAFITFLGILLKKYGLGNKTRYSIPITTILFVAGQIFYMILTHDSPKDDLFYIGWLYITLSSIVVMLSILVTFSMYPMPLFKNIGIIAFGFFVNFLGDLGYYAAENTAAGYHYLGWYNVAWFAAILIILFSMPEYGRPYKNA